MGESTLSLNQPTAFDIAEWATDAAKYIGGLSDDVSAQIGASVSLRYVDATTPPQGGE